MENASKALLMAGVILIVLIVITLVVNLYNVFRNTNIDLSQRVDSSKVQYHNSQFIVYGKDKVDYSEVEKLILIADNSNKAKTDFFVNVYLNGKVINNIDEFKSKEIDKLTIFRVVTDVDENGIINVINISY